LPKERLMAGKGVILFPTGDVYMTPGASRLFITTEYRPEDFLARHITGDWGDLCEEDTQANDQAVIEGTRIFSSYKVEAQGFEKVWVITEWDRSSTTFLLPEEY
jgi:hypothetical protein